MRTRLLALTAVALLSGGCASALEVLAPRYFYGNLVEEGADEVCLADPRDDEPEATRCFALESAGVPEEAREGDLLAVRYDLREDESEVATSVRVVEAR